MTDLTGNLYILTGAALLELVCFSIYDEKKEGRSIFDSRSFTAFFYRGAWVMKLIVMAYLLASYTSLSGGLSILLAVVCSFVSSPLIILISYGVKSLSRTPFEFKRKNRKEQFDESKHDYSVFTVRNKKSNSQ